MLHKKRGSQQKKAYCRASTQHRQDHFWTPQLQGPRCLEDEEIPGRVHRRTVRVTLSLEIKPSQV